MKKYAIEFFEQGYNCSQCLLKAGEQKYKLSIPNKCYQMLSGVNTGFGVGGICSVLIAGVMLFGLIFDEQTAKRLRMRLLSEFSDQHSYINCDALRKKMTNGYCENVISSAADIVDRIITEELRFR